MLSIHDFHYSSDAPYPPIKAESGNPAYARVMLDNIGGSNSEMSAISLYVFNQLITGCQSCIPQGQHCGNAPSGNIWQAGPAAGRGAAAVDSARM